MSTQYIPKTQAIIEIMQRTGAGRFVIEKKINEMEGAGLLRFIDDPRDSRKKLMSKADQEKVTQALTAI